MMTAVLIAVIIAALILLLLWCLLLWHLALYNCLLDFRYAWSRFLYVISFKPGTLPVLFSFFLISFLNFFSVGVSVYEFLFLFLASESFILETEMKSWHRYSFQETFFALLVETTGLLQLQAHLWYLRHRHRHRRPSPL